MNTLIGTSRKAIGRISPCLKYAFVQGVLIGICIALKHKKTVMAIAAVVFGFTYVPLMKKFIGIIIDDNK